MRQQESKNAVRLPADAYVCVRVALPTNQSSAGLIDRTVRLRLPELLSPKFSEPVLTTAPTFGLPKALLRHDCVSWKLIGFPETWRQSISLPRKWLGTTRSSSDSTESRVERMVRAAERGWLCRVPRKFAFRFLSQLVNDMG